jgi:hypothetical protein
MGCVIRPLDDSAGRWVGLEVRLSRYRHPAALEAVAEPAAPPATDGCIRALVERLPEISVAGSVR